MKAAFRLPSPICVAGPAPAGNASGYGASVAAASSYDRELDAMVRHVMARQKLLAAAIDEKMARDPEFRRMHLGARDFFQADPEAKPGETCTAVWMRQGELVAISLTVPDIDKAIDTMLDVEQFEILIDGKRVSNIGWSGGNDARDRLRECVHPG